MNHPGPLFSFPSILPRWRDYFKTRSGRINAALTTGSVVLVLLFFSRFLETIELRAGVVLDDPVLELFRPTDLTWITFSLIYASLFLAVLHLLYQPRQLVLCLQAYGVMVLIRMAAMAALPLEPPPGTIVLSDPLVEFVVGTDKVLTKDLFFSGHTSTLFLFALVSTNPLLRFVFFLCSFAVAGCLLLQHVHYTVDVLVAPFVSYGAYRIASLVNPVEKKG